MITSSSSNGNSVNFGTSLDTSPEELQEVYSELLEIYELIIEKGGDEQTDALIGKKMLKIIDLGCSKGFIGFIH